MDTVFPVFSSTTDWEMFMLCVNVVRMSANINRNLTENTTRKSNTILAVGLTQSVWGGVGVGGGGRCHYRSKNEGVMVVIYTNFIL